MFPEAGVGTHAQLIDLALQQVSRAITEATPALFEALRLAPFSSVQRVFAGLVQNPPQCWVMPINTKLAEQETLIDQVHTLTVRAAVTAGSPEDVGAAVVRYTQVVDQAIRDWAAWDARILRVFIAGHEYGQLYEHKTGFVRWADLEVVVQQVEVWQ